MLVTLVLVTLVLVTLVLVTLVLNAAMLVVLFTGCFVWAISYWLSSSSAHRACWLCCAKLFSSSLCYCWLVSCYLSLSSCRLGCALLVLFTVDVTVLVYVCWLSC
ncbi:hypothetical protein V8B55DRAFT_1327299 [Mucor lusitanicus]|uniref:Uncharacterized protein n=1 Tax=Mucor circinelloides f. lusitanicus TaxID=29924 RepID=A0A8H4B925_MUCCL|nr:hypothetical protein FB192DRAFT_1402749 [Mucor lusitanicus]